MRFILGILLIVAFLYGCNRLFQSYDAVKRQEAAQQSGGQEAIGSGGNALPGMPPSLEPALQAAKQRGAPGLAEFLRQYRYAISDPRLADIELDYVVLVSLSDPAEARRVFKSVQQRTPQNSPVSARVKRLEKNYQ